MGKPLGGLASPRKRKEREKQQLQPQPQPSTPHKHVGAEADSPVQVDDSPAAAACAASPLEAWQRCAGLLREAVVDPGSAAAAHVPLRPSLRRIKDDLVRVLDEAVSSQNGNAALLVLGPPGTGKTLVVERALLEICTKHNAPPPTDATDAAATATATAAPASAAAAAAGPGAAPAAPAAGVVRNVGVVRLSGLLQPDERTAFQEVARQLCRDFGQKFVKSASFDENLVFLKGMLHALYKCLKKVVFVVDEFQQYAKRGKQQMLYYLLDMLQDSKIQAAVIGISSAHNVAEDLEKRVLSRVGRRRVLVTFPAPPPEGQGQDESMGAGPSTSAASPARAGSSGAAAAGGSTTALPCDTASDSYGGLLHDMLALHPGMEALAGLGGGAAEAHNGALATALRDTRVVDALAKLALIGSPPQHVALVAEGALVSWAADLSGRRAAELGQRQRHGQGPPVALSAAHVVEALRAVADAPERSLIDAVSGLAVLPLVLLVAAHRLQRKGQAMCNFEMAWDEYRSIQGQRGAIMFGKEAAAAAWQGLPLSGLAHYSDANAEARGRDLSYAGVVLLVGSHELEAGIRAHPHCPDAVTKFYMQEI